MDVHVAKAHDFQQDEIRNNPNTMGATSSSSAAQSSSSSAKADAQGLLRQQLQTEAVGVQVDGDKICKQPASLVTCACAGGSTYVDLIKTQMGYD